MRRDDKPESRAQRRASGRYLLSGAVVESDLPLRTAPPAREGVAPVSSVRLRLGPITPPPIASWEELETGLTVGRHPLGYVLRYASYASFWLDRSGREITCEIAPDTHPEIVEQLFVDQILPLILHVQGRYAFHASAVAGDAGVLAFLGDTGRGKSTLATSLAAEGTARIFCDDCLAVSIEGARVDAHPSYASTRLWPESADALLAARGPLPLATPRLSKRRVALPWDGAPLPLRRVYLLEPAEGPVTIERLGRAAALGAILRHVFRFEGLDRERLTAEMGFLEALVTHVPVARLAFRRSFDELPAVQRAILADAAEAR